jgi:hypothetical protein
MVKEIPDMYPCHATDGKTLSHTGVWIRFDYALSDPTLCKGLRLIGDKDTRVASYTTV